MQWLRLTRFACICFTLISFISFQLRCSRAESERESLHDKRPINDCCGKNGTVNFYCDSMLTSHSGDLLFPSETFFVSSSIFTQSLPSSLSACMMQSIHIFVALVLGSLIDFSAAEPRVVCYYTNWSVYRPVSSTTRELEFFFFADF